MQHSSEFGNLLKGNYGTVTQINTFMTVSSSIFETCTNLMILSITFSQHLKVLKWPWQCPGLNPSYQVDRDF